MQVRAHYCDVDCEITTNNKWRWFLPYEDPCQCTSVHFGCMHMKTKIRYFEPQYVDQPLVSTDTEKMREHYGLQCKGIESLDCWSLVALRPRFSPSWLSAKEHSRNRIHRIGSLLSDLV